MNSFGTTRSSWNLDTLFTFKDISEKTKDYMVKVYGNLMLDCVICALGMFVNQSIMLEGFFM